jgi:hypothetical protein
MKIIAIASEVAKSVQTPADLFLKGLIQPQRQY